jgi:hypothetical protein
MSKTVLKTKELPLDVQVLLKTCYNFNKREVKVEPVIDFTCKTNWHDANCMTLVGYNQLTGKHVAQASGYYDSYCNFTAAEKAMYHGKLATKIEGPHMWFFLIETYPAGCTVYCHPDALAKAIAPPPMELDKRLQIVLYITRSLIAPARIEEARRFKFTTREYLACKAELIDLGLINKAGALTTAGKNASSSLNFNTWEV